MRTLKPIFFTLVLLFANTACLAGTGGEAETGGGHQDLPSGTLVLPGEREATGRESAGEKKCMKVCKEWGETCIIDPRTGARKCRRSCERFGVECF